MKKWTTLILILAMLFSFGAAASADDVEVVRYYCSIGAYLDTLQKEIDRWNAGEGAAKGVCIELISEIDTYPAGLVAQMEAGTFYDLMDISTSCQDWIERGWVQDLTAIDDAALKEQIEGYADYLVNGIHIQGGILYALPLEVVPIKLAVNTDLFEKNGLELPKTWDDIVECARIITENGNGDAFGFGWSTWSLGFRRLAFEASMNSTGVGWFDVNTETYDFAPFRKSIECMAEMYQNGYILGADDLSINEIRAQFAAGKVGMFPAPSYDYAEYTGQFPATCNWTVIDMPTIEAGEAPFKGVYLDRVGCAICKPRYDEASDAKKQAIVDAFVFLNSDELNSAIYAVGGMIPYKTDIIENTVLSENLGPQWALFSDIANDTGMSLFPDSLLPLEGDDFTTVMEKIMRGELEWDDAVEDLNKRYNDAYQRLKDDGDVDLSIYSYDYNIAR